MTQQQRVGPLVEGAFLALITAIMGTLAIYFLPVKFLVDFIWGIPIIIIIKRYNLRIGILTLATTFFITWMFTEPVTTFLLVLELAPLALAYGLLFKYEIPPGTVLLTGAAVSVLSTMLTVLGFIYIANINVIPTEQALRMQAQQSVALYTNMGLVNAGDSKTLIDTTAKLMIAFIPSILAIASVIRAFFSYVLAVKVLRRLNYKVPDFPPFSEWALPWYSIWLIITGLGLSVFGDQYKIGIMATAAKNMLFIVSPLFFLIGFSVVTHFFKTWRIPKWTKVLLGIAAVINLGGSLVLFTLIGMFDPVFSFRKWKRLTDS